MSFSRVAASSALVLVACTGAPSPHPTATSSKRPAVASAKASTAAGASASTADASAAPPTAASCFVGHPKGEVGYDAKTDVITVCGEGAGQCLSFPLSGKPLQAKQPEHRLDETPRLALRQDREPMRVSRSGARVVVDGDPKRWVALAHGAHALWSSADRNRALLRTKHTRATVGGPTLEELFLVDFSAHSILAQASMCGDFAGADAVTNDDETLLLAKYYVDDAPSIKVALVDLEHSKFIAIRPGAKPLSSTACTSEWLTPQFAKDDDFGVLVDPTHRRTATALLTLDGVVIATLAGDHPDCGSGFRQPNCREFQVDANARIIVAEMPDSSLVCVGRAQLLPVASTSARRASRCIPRCAERGGGFDESTQFF
jgi:hypothetical protein